MISVGKLKEKRDKLAHTARVLWSSSWLCLLPQHISCWWQRALPMWKHRVLLVAISGHLLRISRHSLNCQLEFSFVTNYNSVRLMNDGLPLRDLTKLNEYSPWRVFFHWKDSRAVVIISFYLYARTFSGDELCYSLTRENCFSLFYHIFSTDLRNDGA